MRLAHLVLGHDRAVIHSVLGCGAFVGSTLATLSLAAGQTGRVGEFGAIDPGIGLLMGRTRSGLTVDGVWHGRGLFA